MLEYLRIQNLALIADMELEFSQGMNVITGETGAGKSFILKAIHFLMGDKLSADIVRQGKERAQIEALFIHPKDGELILRRELSSVTGRSRFYINDSLSSAETLKALRSKLIIHTSQHGQQKLLQPSFQEHIIDTYVDKPDLFIKKIQIIEKIKDCLAKEELCSKRLKDLEEKRDLFNMYLEEIDKVNPKPEEDEQLETVREQFKLTDVKQKYYNEVLATFFDGEISLTTMFSSLKNDILNIIPFDNALSLYVEFISEVKDKLYDLEGVLRGASNISEDTTIDIEQVESRLYTLSQLKRKLHRSLPEIFLLKEEIEENLSFLDMCFLDIRQIKKEYIYLLEELKIILHIINDERYKAAQSFCHRIKTELVELGFSEHVNVIVDFIGHEIFPGCVEKKVCFLWAPNPGHPPKPLEHIISGGELSRFLLALISIRSSSEGGMLIFDEIDTGIGGQTLKIVAHKLAILAEQKQILVVTHWPQIATKASRHFYITKNIQDSSTYTQCKQLKDIEKEQELLRMACI